MEHTEIACTKCPMKTKYDKNPKSLIGRFWRWHISIYTGILSGLENVSKIAYR